MALPVAHGLLGASVAVLFTERRTLEWRTILTAAALAIAPDCDYVFYRILDWGEGWHRSFSHSLLFAIVAGVAAALIVGPRRNRSFWIYFLATLSHPVLDAVISQGPGGVEFLWPISRHLFRIGIVGYPSIFAGRPNVGELIIRVLEISAIELLVFLPLLMLATWFRNESAAHVR